jgi:PAS domain S-box-containing protein
LIATLHAAERRLEELTGGEVDTVADGLGRPFLLRHAQEDLRESAGAWQAAILDALPANIALLDSAGIVTSVNEGWRRFADANGPQSPAYGIGLDYVAICERAASEDSPGAQPAAEAVRGCLAGGAPSAAIEYPCHSPTEQRWFVMTVTAVSHAFPRGAVVMHLDVTGRRRVEEMLRQASQGVVRGRRKRIRAELLILVAATAVFLGLSLGLDWLEGAAEWISARAVGEIDGIIFTTVFALAGLTVFALRRWRESESELNTREQSLAVEGTLREELERRVRQRTEELGRTNQSLNAEIAERKRSEQTAERALQRLTEAQRIGQFGDWELDLATQAISWSPQVFEILGRDPRLGPPDYLEHNAMYEAASQSVQAENVARVLESGNPQDYELRARRPNGERVDILGRAVARKDENGRVVGLFGTVQDITERKIAEEKIVHLSRVRAMLSGISGLIVRVSAREELFKGACRVAVEAGGFRMSLIAIVDPELGRIVPLASAGKDDGLMSAVNSLLSEPELAPQTMVAKAIWMKKAIVSNDSQSDPRVLLGPQYTESAVRSIAVLPLIVSDEAVGVLALYSSEVEFFHEEEMKLLTDLANEIAFGLGAIQARAERERAVEALRSSLKDKEALLKEVHHRVKNNMQVITSLLRLESNRIDHPATRSVLKDMQNRIQAMAALHEAVYRSDNFSQVDLGAYLRQITGQLGRSLIAVPGQISFRLDLISVTLDLDQAIPCGLIVNELVSNALKHAFPDGRSGEVRIELERMEGGDLRLQITDNGIGLPPDFDVIRAKSLGLQLVSDLARQLGGSLQVGPGPEAVFEVRMACR